MSLLPFGNPSTENLVLYPPTPYTLSPLLKGGEGRGEGGSYTRMPCLFGALLVTLYQIFSKGFLNRKGLKRKFISGNSISVTFGVFTMASVNGI